MSHMLFDDALAPITSEIGFLQRECVEVAAEFYRWHKAIYNKRSVALVRRSVAGELRNVLQSLLPLVDILPTRYLFVPTAAEWTAYFDNGWRGGDPASVVSQLSLNLGCRGLRIVCIPNTIRRTSKGWKGRYGGTILEVYGPQPNPILNTDRSVSVVNDGGKWDFDANGQPLPFENLEQYKARRVRDRFTPDMLVQYLEHLGVRAFSEDFYVASDTRPAHLVCELGPRRPNSREYSLKEARANY